MTSRRLDRRILACGALLGLLAASIGTLEVARWDGPPDSYRAYFAPAVLSACGRGLVSPAEDTVFWWRFFTTLRPPTATTDDAREPLRQFLASSRDTFDCSLLPGEVPRGTLDSVQRQTRYLQWTVARVWAVRGISWRALAPLHGLFHGLAVTAAFGILALCVDWKLALAGGLALATSPVQLSVLPQLRDFAKAPFLLLGLFLLLLLDRSLARPRSAGLVGLALGAVIGIGLGFRQDALSLFPLVLLVLLLGAGATVRSRALGLAGVIAGTALTGLPALRVAGSSGNWANVIQGFMAPYDTTLGVHADYYQVGPVAHDAYAYTVLWSYAKRRLSAVEPPLQGGPTFEAASRGYALELARHFPADLLIRAYSSAAQVLDLPFTGSGLQRRGDEPWVVDRWSRMLFRARESLFSLLAGFGSYIGVAAVALLALSRPRAALLLACAGCYLIVLPISQFSLRHYFHLEFLGLWALAFACTAVARAATSARLLSRTAVRVGLICLAFAGVARASLWVARSIQTHVLRRLFERYDAALTHSVSFRLEPLAGSGRVMLRLPEPDEPGHDSRGAMALRTRYLAVDFRGGRCRDRGVEAVVRYGGPTPALYPTYAPSFTIGGRLESGLTLSFPVYDVIGPLWGTRFEGLELAREAAECVSAVREAPRVDAALLLTTVRPSGWKEAGLYQELAGWPAHPLDHWLTVRLRAPDVLVERPVGTWNLLGYDVLSPGRLRVHWMAPASTQPEASASFRHESGRRWVQIVDDARDLAKDGDFESTHAFDSFPGDIYDAPPGVRRRSRVTRDGRETEVAVLDNRPAVLRSSLVSLVLKVAPSKLYLQSAYVRTEKGGAHVARRWQPGGETDYVVSGAAPAEWRRYADLAVPPPDASAVQLWLLNTAGGGVVAFDDLTFYEIGIPDAVRLGAFSGATR